MCKSIPEKSEINIRVSDLHDDSNTFLRFIRIIILSGRHRNKYCVNLKEFNLRFIVVPFQSFLSDFQAHGLKRERERSKGYGSLTETVLQYSTLMLSSRRGHSIDVSENVSDRFRQFKIFYSFEKYLLMDFLELPKNYSRKAALWSLGLLMLQRGVFRTQSNNYDVGVNYFRKKSPSQMFD